MNAQTPSSEEHSDLPHVVIIGGGFGGLACAQALRNARVRVTLIDRRNFHLFQPLLYQVATGGLSPANIATPLRKVLTRQKNVQVLLGEVTAIDPEARQVRLGPRLLNYDYLVVATGSGHHYFGNDGWEEYAPGLKTVEDATRIRRHILSAFELAELETEPEDVRHYLTFVVIGAGPTGVELAGALSEIARHTLRHEFRTIRPEDAHIILLEHAPHVLPVYPEPLSEAARKMLGELNVEVRTGVRVTNITSECVDVETPEGKEVIRARTVLWAAGVCASPLGSQVAEAAGVELARGGRVKVAPDLSLAGYPDTFVIGDLAYALDEEGNPLPGIAPVAVQQGQYVAKLIASGQESGGRAPFRYFDAGSAATIGRRRAVGIIFKKQLSGTIAWLAWLFIHLMKLVSFENRVLVLNQWAWNYLTRNRSARLITGSEHGRE